MTTAGTAARRSVQDGDYSMAKKSMPNDIVVGTNLRTIRINRNITQAELGAGIGVTFQQIQKYESGRDRVSSSRLLMVCNVLECTINDLFQGTSTHEGDRSSTAFPSFSKQALKAAELFDQIEDNTTRSSLLKVMKAMISNQA